MPDRRTYRLALAAILAALVVVAFSVQGVPAPLDPGPVATEFDQTRAIANTKSLLAAAPERAPGSEGDRSAADLVADQFSQNRIGEVAEQEFTAKVGGEERDLRNVVLTLPGAVEEAILLIASRDEDDGVGATTSAAATGVLLELAAQLGIADRDHTLVLASTAGGGAGARAVIEKLGGVDAVRAAIVIVQPGVSEPRPPHLLAGSSDVSSASIGLVETAAALLDERGELSAGTPGAVGQLARLAIPAAAFEHAALIADGVDAISLSGSGEAPVDDAGAGKEEVSAESLGRIGAAAIAVTAALDVDESALEHGPAAYVRVGDNLVPGWAIAVLALALLTPAGAASLSRLALAHRRDDSARSAASWALGWALPPLAALLALYSLSVIGLIPSPDSPFEPSGFDFGPAEVVALLFCAATGFGLWWALGVRILPAQRDCATLLAATSLGSVLACLVVWAVNPFLALLLAPLTHLLVLGWLNPPARRLLSLPLTVGLALPLLIAVAIVGSTLDWGASAPWQLALLVSGNGLSVVAVTGGAALGGLVACALWAALAGEAPPAREGSPPTGA